jgi:hypothetical protein
MEEYSLETRLEKRANGPFVLEDLSDWVQERVAPKATVIRLIRGKWVKAGNFWLLLQEVRSDLDDAYIRVVVRPDSPFLNWLLLPLAANDEGDWVAWWNKIPGTNLMLDIWYVGDGSEGVALIAESL